MIEQTLTCSGKLIDCRHVATIAQTRVRTLTHHPSTTTTLLVLYIHIYILVLAARMSSSSTAVPSTSTHTRRNRLISHVYQAPSSFNSFAAFCKHLGHAWSIDMKTLCTQYDTSLNHTMPHDLAFYVAYIAYYFAFESVYDAKAYLYDAWYETVRNVNHLDKKVHFLLWHRLFSVCKTYLYRSDPEDDTTEWCQVRRLLEPHILTTNEYQQRLDMYARQTL